MQEMSVAEGLTLLAVGTAIPLSFIVMGLWMYNNHPSTWKWNPFANMPGYKFRQRLWELENENQS